MSKKTQSHLLAERMMFLSGLSEMGGMGPGYKPYGMRYDAPSEEHMCSSCGEPVEECECQHEEHEEMCPSCGAPASECGCHSSEEHEDVCPSCGEAVDQCICQPIGGIYGLKSGPGTDLGAHNYGNFYESRLRNRIKRVLREVVGRR